MVMPLPQTTRQYYLPKFDGVHNLTMREAVVTPPKHSEVLVKIHAASLQFRDLLLAKGKYPVPAIKENVVPLCDMAGEIIAVGDEVEEWKVGDRVCANFWVDHIFGEFKSGYLLSALGAPIDGVLTEYKVFPVHCLVRAPDHLSYEEASTLPCAALTAYTALQGSIPAKGGDTVLIQGTGGVAIFGLQFAIALGATVIATSSSDAKLKVAARLGAKHLINYKTMPDWDEEVLRITNGRGVDHVIEVGGSGTLTKSLNSVCYGGSVHVVGVVAADGDISTLPQQVMLKNASLHGVIVGSRVQFEAMNRLISANLIKPVVDKVFPFEDAQKAYEHLDSQKHVGKVVIKISKD
ncbi:hypothetical protein BKA93DRAFT_143104 [Sparassis latifolia]|uniref:Zinc-type alcohol dehydrogenase-like protein n=1 Tax=Sparassis crispa TaxID=139825 RepID=A0A401GV33_9APHY|nr:Zinc-type alcohol dehydrogenase-like protein [Sparassis crispa]GBE86097.1 Zinc-type alcohol dehydrogenase-like protein [Sparassis crispa]